MRRSRLLTVLALCASALLAFPSAAAHATPTKPACPSGALGTARTIVLGTQGGFVVGLKTYPQALALADHEVVLTFDDGPAATTPLVLAALARQCVHATFFLIGRNAEARPALVRQELADGHTIGHHTFSHPGETLRLMSEQAARADIDRGFAADDEAAYGKVQDEKSGVAKSEPTPRVPFFRFPGFADTPQLDAWLKSRNIGIFGTDLWASDWLEMTPTEELQTILTRLDKEGRGILLLHDSRRSTALMLPKLLIALKQRGYRIVHLVPGTGAPPPKFREAPKGWKSETEEILTKIVPHLKTKVHGAKRRPSGMPEPGL